MTPRPIRTVCKAAAWVALLGCSSPTKEDAPASSSATPTSSAAPTVSSSAVIPDGRCELRARYRTSEPESHKIAEAVVQLSRHSGELLATCDGRGARCANQIEIWSTATGERRIRASAATKLDPRADLAWADFSDDGSAILTAHHSVVTIRDPETLAARAELAARQIDSSPKTARAVAGHDDGSAMLIDLVTGTVLANHKVESRSDSPASTQWLATGERVLVGDSVVELWDAVKGTERTELKMPPSFPDRQYGLPVAVSADGKRIAIGGKEGRVDVYDAVTAKLERKLRGGEPTAEGATITTPGMALALSRDGALLAMTHESYLEIWDVATGKMRIALPLAGAPALFVTKELQFSPNGQLLAWADGEGVLRVTPTSSAEIMTFRAPESTTGEFTRIAWSDASDEVSIFPSCGYDRRARTWKLSTKEPVDTSGHSPIDPCRRYGKGRELSLVSELNTITLTRASDKDALSIPEGVAGEGALDVVFSIQHNVFDGPAEAAMLALGCKTGEGGETRPVTEAELNGHRRPGLLKAFLTGANVQK